MLSELIVICKPKQTVMKHFYLFCLLFSCLYGFSQAPKITSFTPISGKPGDEITLTGTNFNTTNANNIVFFGATRATVTSATATGLTVTVPTGATYAPITVLNSGTNLAAYSLKNFTPTYNPAKTDISATSFSPKVDYISGTSPRNIAIGDIDGDGKPDMIVANNGSSTISIYRNTSTSGTLGSESFAPKVDFITPSGIENQCYKLYHSSQTATF